MSSRRAALAIPLLAAAGLAACGSEGGQEKPKPKLRVVATTAQAADFVRAVGGSRIKVDQLIPNRSDPHAFEPKPDEVRRALKDADLVIRSGGGLDAWLPELADDAGVDQIDVVDLSKAVVLRERRDVVDFHWWQDPRNVAAATLKIRDELIKRDNDGSRPYRAAAARYRRKLSRLQRDAAACLGIVPPPDRKLFTGHEAFGYLAARYRLTVLDAGAIGQARAAFTEYGIEASDVRDLAGRAGVPIAGALYGDTLAAPGSADARFLDAFAHNVRVIGTGLGAPPGNCDLPG